MKAINTTNKKTVNVNNFHKEQTENTTKEANQINLRLAQENEINRVFRCKMFQIISISGKTFYVPS